MTPRRRIELEAPTVDMAIGLAVKQLNVPRERLHIEVLREEKKGLFGMKGERPAKIRVKILPEDKVL